MRDNFKSENKWPDNNAEEWDWSHPAKQDKKVIFSDPDKQGPGAFWGPMRDLCQNCGWNVANEHTSYCSRLKMMYAKFGYGIWTIGTQWVLRDELNIWTLGKHYKTLKFLHEQPNLTIPIPEIQLLTKEDEPVQITLETRMQGHRLKNIWEGLPAEQKTHCIDQMVDILKQMRQWTAPQPQAVDGEPLPDRIISNCGGRGTGPRGPGQCHTIPATTDEWMEKLGADIRLGLCYSLHTTDPAVIEARFEEIKREFPNPEPYVFSHGDLSDENIFIKDGKIEGIVDWRHAGYYPWWVEGYHSYALSSSDYSGGFWDEVWKRLVPDMNQESWCALFYGKRGIGAARMAYFNVFRKHVYPKGSWNKSAVCPHDTRSMGVYDVMDWGVKPLACQIDTEKVGKKELRFAETLDRKDPWAIDPLAREENLKIHRAWDQVGVQKLQEQKTEPKDTADEFGL